MSFSMTRKQHELLDFLKFYMAESEGVCPSFEEMKDAVGLASKSGVHRLLSALEERGKIIRTKNRARCISIAPENVLADFPSCLLIAELARRGEEASGRRRAA